MPVCALCAPVLRLWHHALLFYRVHFSVCVLLIYVNIKHFIFCFLVVVGPGFTYNMQTLPGIQNYWFPCTCLPNRTLQIRDPFSSQNHCVISPSQTRIWDKIFLYVIKDLDFLWFLSIIYGWSWLEKYLEALLCLRIVLRSCVRGKNERFLEELFKHFKSNILPFLGVALNIITFLCYKIHMWGMT